MQAVILAGGQGSRLAPYVKNIPKVLVKIGGKSVIEHQIELLKNHDIQDVWVLLGYAGDEIKNNISRISREGMDIHFIQEKEPLGTAGALGQLAENIKEDFLVLSGDVMLNLDFQRFINWHKRKKGALASLAVHPTDHPQDSDLVEVGIEGEIKALFQRPHGSAKLPNLSIASVFIFSPDIFDHIAAGKKNDIEKDMLPEILKSDKKVFAYKTQAYIKDMGTPERLEQVKKDYLLGKIAKTA